VASLKERMISRTLDDDVTALLRGERATTQDPYPLYARLREEAPVYLYDSTTAIVSTHREAKTVYRENVRFPNPEERGTQFEGRLRLLTDEDRDLYAKIMDFERAYLSRMNGETHRRVRTAGQRAFTPKRLREMEESVQQLTDELLDELAAQERPDFKDFAYRLPLIVIMDMMGAPRADGDKLKEWGDAINAPSGETPLTRETLRRAYDASLEYREYVRELVERHRRQPDPTTLVSALLDASEGDRLSEEELVGMYVLILFAGHETTANMFGNGLFALLRHRDQWERLVADPSLAPGAVEEVLRYDSPVQFFRKYTVAEQELAGVTIPAGMFVMAANGAANRDPLEFEEPDDLDIARRPNDQLSLGYGAHFCLGAGVARLEGRIGFETLARRFPAIELAVDPAEVEYGSHLTLRGVESLPVRLDGRRK
jgi:cytochrome P450